MLRLILFVLVNGLSGVVPVLAAQHGVILQYHHVAGNTPAATSVSPKLFERHMTFLHDNGFRVWPLDKLVNQLQADKPVPDGVIVITFDDAYDDVYQNAAPLLKQLGYPFTVFISTDFVDGSQKGYMTWSQLNALQKQGALMANHTRTHPHLLRQLAGETALQWQARVRAEIDGAEQRIKQQTGDNLRYLAYPYGEADAHIIQWVKAWGYLGIGQQSGAMDKAALASGMVPRFPFNTAYNDLQDFQYKASSLPLPVLEERAPDTIREQATIPLLALRLPEQVSILTCYASGQGEIRVVRQPPQWFSVTALRNIAVGRSRYNCTAPVQGKALQDLSLQLKPRFYWYSRMWIRKQDDGGWYPEP